MLGHDVNTNVSVVMYFPCHQFSRLAENAARSQIPFDEENFTPDEEDTDNEDYNLTSNSITEIMDLYEEEDSDFMTEFKNHTLENRRSEGRLSELILFFLVYLDGCFWLISYIQKIIFKIEHYS